MIIMDQMTDFGHRSQQDPEFNEQYKEEKKFKERILNDDAFAKNMAT